MVFFWSVGLKDDSSSLEYSLHNQMGFAHGNGSAFRNFAIINDIVQFEKKIKEKDFIPLQS